MNNLDLKTEGKKQSCKSESKVSKLKAFTTKKGPFL